MPNANPSEVRSENPEKVDPPETGQRRAIIFSLVVLGFWVLWSVYAEHWVEPVILIFEWFEQLWRLDVLPGREP
jgi:hypothetical protein